MFDFVISAPGKINLLGEHMFTRGEQTVLSASLNLNTTLIFAEQPYSTGIIRIEYPQIGLFSNIYVWKLRDYFYDYRMYIEDIYLLHRRVQNFIMQEKFCQTRDQRTYLQAFLFLLVYVRHKQKMLSRLRPFRVIMHTDLRFSAESGCAESSAVCLAACFLYWTRLQNRSLETDTTFDIYDLDMIAKYARDCEEYIHGYEGFVNVIQCTYGNMIQYNGDTVVVLPHVPNMAILLIDTKKKRDLTHQKSILHKFYYTHPRVFMRILKVLETTATTAIQVLYRLSEIYGEINIREEERIERLKDEQRQLQCLICVHQRILKYLKVSYPRLNIICKIAQRYGLVGKYSDLSAGRYAYIRLLPDMSERVITSLKNKLFEYGFTSRLVNLSCHGVRVV